MADDRYDVVLLGATGFTGALTAEYLAAHAPAGTRWALAGRSRAKLEAVRARLSVGDVPLLEVDVGDPGSVRAMAEAARVVITTVGPYIRFGEPVVAACAAAGCAYVDLTGEPEFVDRMYLRYHDQAVATGARLVHSCGFDSIPYDLGALFTVSQIGGGEPVALSGYVRAGGTFSGGTLHSAVEIMGRLRQGRAVARERRAREGGETTPPGRRVRGIAGRPRLEPLAGGWVVPAPTIDPQHVLRSARALEVYGPDFAYSHYLVTGGLPMTVGLVGGVGAVAALAQVGAGRSLLRRIRSPGDGPSAEQRARSFFRVRFVAQTPSQRLLTEVSGGDPGYGETSKMLAESALCLAHDDLPPRAGQLTPAVAMGQALIDRLVAAGIRFERTDRAESDR
jgi:short subunit dehydrogenase-like uncharacterized protein